MEDTSVKGLSYHRNLVETRFPPEMTSDPKAANRMNFHPRTLSVTI